MATQTQEELLAAHLEEQKLHVCLSIPFLHFSLFLDEVFMDACALVSVKDDVYLSGLDKVDC